MKRKIVPLRIRISEDERIALEKVAEKEDLNLSEVVREFIRSGLENRAYRPTMKELIDALD
jgi:hypothetical protein